MEGFRANPSPIGITVALQFKKYSCDHQRIADRTISAITYLSDLAAITDLWIGSLIAVLSLAAMFHTYVGINQNTLYTRTNACRRARLQLPRKDQV